MVVFVGSLFGRLAQLPAGFILIKHLQIPHARAVSLSDHGAAAGNHLASDWIAVDSIYGWGDVTLLGGAETLSCLPSHNARSNRGMNIHDI